MVRKLVVLVVIAAVVGWAGAAHAQSIGDKGKAVRQGDAGKVAAVPSGVKFSTGESVQVLWKGTWYDASVLAVNDKKGTYKVHYDGYDTSWDEWVGNNRIKNR